MTMAAEKNENMLQKRLDKLDFLCTGAHVGAVRRRRPFSGSARGKQNTSWGNLWFFLCDQGEYMRKSQNHRMVGVGRDFCGSSSPTPLQKQGHLQQAVEDLVQAGLEYLQRRRLHNKWDGKPTADLEERVRELKKKIAQKKSYSGFQWAVVQTG